MPYEIERKFLVKDDRWRGLAEGRLYRQGYLSSHADRTVRVRIAGLSAFLTVKGRNEGGKALEYEYPIPLHDAEIMLEKLALKPLVEKMRCKVPYQGLTWEIDEFLGENSGLVLAEVELESLEQNIELPEWVGEEVTGDPRYFNANLIKNPYRLWGGADSAARS